MFILKSFNPSLEFENSLKTYLYNEVLFNEKIVREFPHKDVTQYDVLLTDGSGYHIKLDKSDCLIEADSALVWDDRCAVIDHIAGEVVFETLPVLGSKAMPISADLFDEIEFNLSTMTKDLKAGLVWDLNFIIMGTSEWVFQMKYIDGIVYISTQGDVPFIDFNGVIKVGAYKFKPLQEVKNARRNQITCLAK